MSATYDVWTDPDLQDLLRSEPALLAVADALSSAPGVDARTGNGRHFQVGRLAAIAAALAAVAVVALAAPWGRSGGDSLNSLALAAIGSQPVLHVVAELPVRSQLIDLKTGEATPVTAEKEIWFDGDRGLEHTIYRSGGLVVWDQLETPQGEITAAGPRTYSRNSKPTIEPALQGFVDGYREALASGAATETGEGTLDGVPVAWLSFALAGRDREEVAVARDSGRPLLVKMCSGPCSTYRIKTIETMGVDSADFNRPVESEAARNAASGVRNDRSLASVDVSSLPDALPGAVWAGPSIDGLPLASAIRANWRTTFGDGAAEDWTGAELVYGTMSSETVPDWEQPFVQVWESARPQTAYLGPAQAPGAPLPAPALNGRLYVPWPDRPPAPPFATNALWGVALVNGVYVTVRASSGELLVAAARALYPIG